ncbi:hypothetical protein EBR57_05290 [bacterium]|nr:hypothetical protein [bacterium]
MVNSFGDVLKYLNYFKVYTQQEVASSDLPIRVATQCLYNALNSGKKLTLGDAITGFNQYR